MGMMLVQKQLVFILLFVFSLNPQLSFSTSLSNVTLPDDSPLTLCHPFQSHALLQFISNFTIGTYVPRECRHDRSYPKTVSWKEGTDCCSWGGVTCDDVTGHVIELDLSCSQLLGTIDSNHNTLFSSHIAPYLHRLNFARNYFGSEISSEFWVKFGSSLTHLNLSSSQIEGNIPSEISLLSNLVSLDMSFNNLRVESDRVFQNIAGNLTQLRVLHLDNMDMSSLHVSSLINLSSSLTSLRLSGCYLHGEFPASFLVYPNLQELDFSGNYEFNPALRISSLPYINSTTPSSSNLLFLDLSFSTSLSIGLLDFVGSYHTSLRYMYVSCCNITGSIPPSLGNLTKLTHLDLEQNHISGPIPTYLSNLTYLTYLDMSDNELDGPIPTSVSNLVHLTYWDMSANKIDGPIPTSFSRLAFLTYLDMSINELDGPIPTSFSNLAHLTHWDMSDNEIEGPLPSYLFALPSLEVVDLSNNKLYGHIITSPINCMNLARIYLSNNSLSGSLDFDVFLSFNQLIILDLSHNNISLSISASTHSNFTYSLPRFDSLYLSNCNLSQFPTFIKAFTNLSQLYVSNSQLQGPIPDWLYDVGKETLVFVDLSENSLTGVIGHLAGWKCIRSIDFHSNLLQGSLPIIPSTVAYFDVSYNHLSGVISSSISNRSLLEVFDLSYNQFTGSIPQCLLNISSLSLLNLGMNKLHGVIPNTFPTDYCYLLALVLRENQLTGPIPPSLALCVNLTLLDLGNNMIEDTVHHWLEKLSSLEVLILRSNKFFGSLNNFKPTIFFPTLRILDVSNNRFDGQVPMMLLKSLIALTKVDEKLEDGNEYLRGGYGTYYSMEITAKGSEMTYVKIWATLSVIDLSKNKFEGSISREIGKLISLKGLSLSHNLLTRHIPSSMGNLASLEWLDLSSNKLNGQIPNELKSMTFLSALNLSHNQLNGPIPQGKQFDTFTNDSYMGNLALCGLPLSKSCGPNHESPSENKVTLVSESGFNWAFAFAGYGCGIVLGLSMGYIVFETGTPKWFVRMVDGKKQRGRVGQRPRRSSGRRRN